jgi:hypothetical protein
LNPEVVMRRFCLLLLLTVLHGVPAAAQSVTIDALMASPFPTELVAAPSGARFAWVQSVEESATSGSRTRPTSPAAGSPATRWTMART